MCVCACVRWCVSMSACPTKHPSAWLTLVVPRQYVARVFLSCRRKHLGLPNTEHIVPAWSPRPHVHRPRREQQYTGACDCAIKMLADEGVGSFYNGLGVGLLAHMHWTFEGRNLHHRVEQLRALWPFPDDGQGKGQVEQLDAPEQHGAATTA